MGRDRGQRDRRMAERIERWWCLDCAHLKYKVCWIGLLYSLVWSIICEWRGSVSFEEERSH